MKLEKKLSLVYCILLASWIVFAVIKDKIDFGYALYAPSLPREVRHIQAVNSITFFKPGYKPSRQNYDEYVGGFWRWIEEHSLGETNYVGSRKCNKDKCQASRILVALYEQDILTGIEHENRITSLELQEFHDQLKGSDLIKSHNLSLEVLQSSAGIAIEAQGNQKNYVFLAYYGRVHGVSGNGSSNFNYKRSPYYEILLQYDKEKNTLVLVKANSFFHGGSHAFSFLNFLIIAFSLLMVLVWLFIVIRILSQCKKAVANTYRRSRKKHPHQQESNAAEQDQP